MKRLVSFLLLMADLSGAVELPGTWSNGKDEFKTISLMLRSDGQAVFATAVIPGWAKWEPTETGLLLTVGGDGTSVTIPFTFDPATAELTGRFRDTEVILEKVSEEQPPDLLERAREEAERRQQSWNNSNHNETRTFPNRSALEAYLQEWRSMNDPTGRPETIFLSTDSEKAQLTLRRLGDSIHLEVFLEHRRLTKLTGYPLESKRLPSDAESDLPLTYELPARQREILMTLAQSPSVVSELNAYSQVSVFETESFSRHIKFIAKPESGPDALVLANQILDILWTTPVAEISAKLHYRIPATR